MKHVLLSISALLCLAATAKADDAKFAVNWGASVVSSVVDIQYTSAWGQYNLAATTPSIDAYSQWRLTYSAASDVQVKLGYGYDSETQAYTKEEYKSLDAPTGSESAVVTYDFLTDQGSLDSFTLQGKTSTAAATIDLLELYNTENSEWEEASWGGVSWGCSAYYVAPSEVNITGSYGTLELLDASASAIAVEASSTTELTITITFSEALTAGVFIEADDDSSNGLKYVHASSGDTKLTATIKGSDLETSVAHVYFKDGGTGSQTIYIESIVLDYGGTSTSIDALATDNQVVEVKYFNIAGAESSVPFKGVNIVKTTYSSGNVSVAKLLK